MSVIHVPGICYSNNLVSYNLYHVYYLALIKLIQWLTTCEFKLGYGLTLETNMITKGDFNNLNNWWWYLKMSALINSSYQFAKAIFENESSYGKHTSETKQL